MIGGSIFNLVGPAMHEGGPSLLIVFLASGIISFFTALTYAELGSAFPEAGGGYRWVKEGLPRPNAFISGWIAWFADMIAGSLYAVSIGDFFGSILTNIGASAQYAGIPIEDLIKPVESPTPRCHPQDFIRFTKVFAQAQNRALADAR